MSFTLNQLLTPLQTGGGGGSGILPTLVFLVLLVLIIAGFWKTFEKAGEPGWAAIIPIYNAYVLIKISGNAWWWLILFFIPIISILASIKISIDVGKKFGQGLAFGLGLGILPFIFYPILGFGRYTYQGAPR